MKNQIENVCKEITDFKTDYKEDIKVLNGKIDGFFKTLDNKANVGDLKELRGWIWALVVGFLMCAIGIISSFQK